MIVHIKFRNDTEMMLQHVAKIEKQDKQIVFSYLEPCYEDLGEFEFVTASENIKYVTISND